MENVLAVSSQTACGTYAKCLDMKCFGGAGTKKKACQSKKWTGLSAAHATAPTHTQSIATTGKNVLFYSKILR